MQIDLPSATLRSGERVAAAIIEGPDPAWADRLERLLLHKGDPWTWENTELLRESTGVGARFYILHRDGRPFSNVLLTETAGVAMLGHVWTEPPDRRTGASSILMEALMADFRKRRGRAIFLGTDYDTPPWHYYHRRGFEAVEPGSGYMELYVEPRADFERAWFGATETVIERLDWKHWATSTPLCIGGFEGAVRLAGVQLVGRICSETPLLPLIREERRRQRTGDPSRACVLRDAAGPGVLGIACRRPHPLWPYTDLLDVYCHPAWWHRAAEMCATVSFGAAKRTLAYADSAHARKCAILREAGLEPAATLPQWAPVPSDAPRVDVTVFAQG